MRYTFDDSFFTGCAFVDDQHRQLFEAINGLLEACEQNKGKEELQKSLDFLAQYTINHFFDEEQALKKYHYSDFYRHHQYHEAFTKTVRDFSKQFALQGGSESLIAEVQKKIGAWLTEHIKGQDFRWAIELKNAAPELFGGESPSIKLREMAQTQRELSAELSATPPPKRRFGLLFKLAGLSSVLICAAMAVLTGVGIFYMKELSFRTAVSVTERRLRGDVAALNRRITQEYGILRLENGHLSDSEGRPLQGRNELVSEASGDMDIDLTIFERNADGFYGVATTLLNPDGSFALNKPMSADSPPRTVLLSGQTFTGEITVLGKPVLGSYAPIFAQGSGEVIGAIFAGVEMSFVHRSIDTAGSRLLLTLALGAVILLFITILLNFNLIKVILLNPVRKITTILQNVEAGDLSQQIKLKQNDEIGDMAKHLDKTIESLKQLVMIIQNEAEAVDDISDELSANMTRTADAMNDINGGIHRVQSEVVQQNDAVRATNAAMERITGNIAQLNSEIETQTKSVSQSSSAIEEMLSSIDSVTEISRTNSANVTRLAEASEVGRTSLQAVAAQMQEIAQESEGLVTIIGVLANIASQTNLLSMNAAIEAAHAGEVGKGFAVVADEIRKLAENAGTQSKTISRILKQIREAITGISGSTREVLAKFEVIEGDVKTVSGQEAEIRKAMEEQSERSRRILEALEKLNEITGTVKNGSEEMRKGSASVIDAGKSLEKVTAEIISGMNDMAYRAEEVNSSVQHVNSVSRKNKSNIETLRDAVSHFTVTDKHYLWDDSLAIGVPKIDEQHKRLFAGVNEFIDAVEQGTGKHKLKKMFDFMIQYTATHFDDEEQVQKQYGYPDYENHRRLHEKFKRTVIELAHEMQHYGTTEGLVKEFKRKVGDWLVTHVKGQDAKIGAYIKNAAQKK
ncbi:MAG: bacteriohemerythrin [Spirochaetaceae bacterium]|jgi:methyl-accepting chemotaxis protein|nr:bacteriohemerythrin [Spirochaetaceae bacterium]